MARGGSKSIKNKNIKFLNGIPLIGHTIKEAKKSKFKFEYIVSTDSNQIKKIALKFGADVPFIRPKKYSTDKSTSVSALKHAVKFMEKKNKVKYDIILELMCTNPLKNHLDIDKVLRKIISTKADTVIAVHRIYDTHPRRVKKIINDKIVDFCIKEKPESRRQDLSPKAYIRSGSIYAIQRNYLMKKNKRYGSINSRPYILPEKRAINIDSYHDFLIAKELYKK